MPCLRGHIACFKVYGPRCFQTARCGCCLLNKLSLDKKRIVAGSILLQFGQTVFYAFTGCAPDDFCLHPHDILQIEAIRGACRGGFRWYDFGEVAEDHEALAQFKTKWGGEPKPLYRYYSPAQVVAACGQPRQTCSISTWDLAASSNESNGSSRGHDLSPHVAVLTAVLGGSQ